MLKMSGGIVVVGADSLRLMTGNCSVQMFEKKTALSFSWSSQRGVIREIVNMLWAYGVRKIYGIKGGYKGVMEPEKWFLGGIRNHPLTWQNGDVG